MRRVLELPQYRRLLCAYTLNELAWIVGLLALAVVVYRRTGSALATTAYFLCSQFVPALFSTLVVARLDQRPTRSVLPALFALQSLAAVALALLATTLPLAPLLAIVMLTGLGTLTTRSLVRVATLGVTTPAGLLREGNALANAAFSVAIAVGPVLGGVVTAAGGARAALLGNAGLLALAALLALGSTGLATAKRQRAAARGRVRAAFRYASAHRDVRSLLGLQAIALLFFTLSVPVEVVFAQRSLHLGAGGYGALLSAWGGGAVLGSAGYARWRRLPGRQTIAIGAGALGVGYLVMAAAPSFAIALVGSAIGGIGNGSEAVAVRSVLQERVEAHWMAMIVSLNDSIAQFMPGAGILLGGAIAAQAGPRAALAVAGGGALGVTAAAWILLRPTPELAFERPEIEPGGAAVETPVSDGDGEHRPRAGRAHPG